MFQPEAKAKIQEELARGHAARADGFEGRARVCARRAAGAAVRAFLEQRGISLPAQSAYDLLAYLQELQEIPPGVQETAARLLTRVNEGFELPEGIDLLADASWLAEALERMS